MNKTNDKAGENFKAEVRDKIIPALKRMLKKEEDHLKELEKSKYNFSVEFIETTKAMIGHLSLRINQYSDFSDK